MLEKAKKRIAVRADGNSTLGMGHLMRCLSIAKALQKQADCVFLVAQEEAGRFVEEKGFGCEVLGTDYLHMEAELPLIKRLQEKYKFSLVLVDSYQCTQKYLNTWMEYCPVYRMDDTGEAQLQTNGLINYNIYGKELSYTDWCNANMKLLLGAEYAPVKEAFLLTPYVVREQVKRILITMGGSDSLNIAGALCEKLLAEVPQEIELQVICGRFNPHLEVLRQLESREPRVEVLVDVQDMWNKMAQADLAISAAGSTMYELSAMGVPTVCCYYVENQRRIAEGFAKEVGILNAGDYTVDESLVLGKIVKEVMLLAGSLKERSSLSQQMKIVTDGRGAERIATYLLRNA